MTLLQLDQLPKSTIEKIKSFRYDHIIEKHEGPVRWGSILDHYHPEFLEIEGKSVLLPVSRDNHQNITILRSNLDKEEKTLTVFLKDTTWLENPKNAFFQAGFMAVCDKVSNEELFIAIVYHEWFIVEEHIGP